MDKDEYHEGPSIYDPMGGRGLFLLDAALKIDMIKDAKTKKLVFDYLRKVSASVRVPMGELVEVNFQQPTEQE